MKKSYILVVCAIMGINFGIGNVVSAGSVDATTRVEESHVIPYPAGYVLDKEGASSYNGIGNVKQSPYYAFQDYYNLKATDSLTLLPILIIQAGMNSKSLK